MNVFFTIITIVLSGLMGMAWGRTAHYDICGPFWRNLRYALYLAESWPILLGVIGALFGHIRLLLLEPLFGLAAFFIGGIIGFIQYKLFGDS